MSTSFSSSVRTALIASAAALLGLLAVTAHADGDAFGPQFQISPPGLPGTGLKAGFPDAALNTATNEYLVVYIAATTDKTDDVYGQRLDAAGNLVGGPFRISAVSQDEEQYNPPSVAYDPESNQFLVVWDREFAMGEEMVYVRLVSADGVPLGATEAPISGVQSDTETEAIAYSTASHEYLVVWKAFSDGRVYAQRLSQAATEVGLDDQIIGGSPELTADDAVEVAYSATSQEYMVVFNAYPPAESKNEEVYGQRLALDASPIGPDDFLISEMGPEGNPPEYKASPASITWNSQLNQYLVTWHGNDGVPPLASDEREGYGQLLAADGTQIGNNDFRITDMGVDGDGKAGAFRPSSAYDPNSNDYLVVWHGDDISGGMVDGEYEVWGQYLAADGSEIGNNDFRISEVLPDGNNDFSANRPAIVFDDSSCDYLVTYFSGDPNTDAVAESAVLGRFASTTTCPDRTAPTITGLRVLPKAIASGAKAKGAKKGASKSKRPAKRAKARYRLSEKARVSFVVERKLRGRKVGRKCRPLKGKKAAPKKRRCALWKRTGRKLRQSGKAGANKKTFTAKSIRKKGLKPGVYRIKGVAVDPVGNVSAAAFARFKVTGG